MPNCQARPEIILKLFDAYYERVFCFARRSVGPEAAEDIAQEVFIRLLKHPDLERLTLSVSYLIKIADNLLKRRYSRSEKYRTVLMEATKGQDPVREALRKPEQDTLDSRILMEALEILTSQERSAVRMIVCEGMSYQHAARALGVSVTTINNWKHRGIKKLKQFIHQSPELSGSHGTTPCRGPGQQGSGEIPPAQPDRIKGSGSGRSSQPTRRSRAI